MNFDRGTLKTNAERSSSSDIARGHFNALKFQIASNSTWYDFVDLDPAGDDDPDFNCIMISQTNQKVEKQAQTCVD